MSQITVNQLRPVHVANTLTAEKGIVDLWYYFYEDVDEELLATHRDLLTAEERERHGSFYFERDRHQFLATRALVRTVLSRYSAVSPADWRFTSNEHGKPVISFPSVTPAIHFNLSNAVGLVACVVSLAHEQVGIDVEGTDRTVEAIELAGRYFSAPETDRLKALPAAEQARGFFAYWTLKESYLKARGVGLSLRTDRFSFLINDEIPVALAGGFADDAALWRFALLAAPPRHMIAISVKTGGSELSLRATEVTPLR